MPPSLGLMPTRSQEEWGDWVRRKSDRAPLIFSYLFRIILYLSHIHSH